MGFVVILLNRGRLVDWRSLRNSLVQNQSRWFRLSPQSAYLCEEGHKLPNTAFLIEREAIEVLGGAE
jgi:hypothetical protein